MQSVTSAQSSETQKLSKSLYIALIALVTDLLSGACPSKKVRCTQLAKPDNQTQKFSLIFSLHSGQNGKYCNNNVHFYPKKAISVLFLAM